MLRKTDLNFEIMKDNPQLNKAKALIQDYLTYYEGNDLLEDFIVLYLAVICWYEKENNLIEAVEFIDKAEVLVE